MKTSYQTKHFTKLEILLYQKKNQKQYFLKQKHTIASHTKLEPTCEIQICTTKNYGLICLYR